MYEIWDGDLFLYHVDTQYEADEANEAGFTIKKSNNNPGCRLGQTQTLDRYL
jgi:hypothetical protein